MVEWKLRWHYTFARVLLALVICYTGMQLLSKGDDFYNPFLHAWRRMLMPETKNKINDNLTWQYINTQVTKVMGGLMIAGGLLILANMRKAGSALVMIVLAFMILTQDNPYIQEFIKPKPKNNHFRMNDFTRHLSLFGTCLFMIVCPEY